VNIDIRFIGLSDEAAMNAAYQVDAPETLVRAARPGSMLDAAPVKLCYVQRTCGEGMLIRRTRLRLGGWLAIFTLAVQLVASFAHVHKEDLLSASAERTISSGLARPSSGGTQSPAQPAGDADHDAGCSICATIALAGATLLPEPPAITFAPDYHTVRLPEDAFAAASGEQRAYFQARGPPA
jgi:hypothetical protein